jgi:hypothetical protein
MENVVAAEETPPARSIPRAGFWSSLVGIVDRPRVTLGAIYARPGASWLAPLLLAFIAVLALTMVSVPFVAEETQEQVRRQVQNLSADQRALVMQQMERFGSVEFLALVGGTTAGLSLLLGVLIAAAVLYFAVLIAGAEIDFGPWFAVTAWTWIPFAIRDAVQAGYVAFLGTPIVNQGLSYLVSVGDPVQDAANLTYFLLSFAQIFVLWHLVLVWAGLRGAARLSAGGATFLVLIYAVISLGLRWIPVVIGRLFAPSL